jgi:hypothetical protein
MRIGGAEAVCRRRPLSQFPVISRLSLVSAGQWVRKRLTTLEFLKSRRDKSNFFPLFPG